MAWLCPMPSLPGGLGGAGDASPRGFPCSRTKGASSSSAGRSRSWLSLRSSRVISGRRAKPVGTEVRRLLCRTRSRRDRSPAAGKCWLRATYGGLTHVDKTLKLKASGSTTWWDNDTYELQATKEVERKGPSGSSEGSQVKCSTEAPVEEEGGGQSPKTLGCRGPHGSGALGSS